MILAPVIRDRKGEHQGVFEEIRRQGFVRVRVDGNVHEIDEAVELNLAKYKKHTIEVVVDRLVIRHEEGVDARRPPRSRAPHRVARDGAADRQRHRRGADHRRSELIVFSEQFACPAHCGDQPRARSSRATSPSTRRTAPARPAPASARRCEFDPELVMPNRELSLAQGAIVPWMRATGEGQRLVRARCWKASPSAYDFGLNVPVARPARGGRSTLILYGSDGEKVTVTLPVPNGPHALLRRRLRRRHPEPEAPLRGDRRPTTSAKRSSATWPSGPARPARARGSSRRVLGVTVGDRSIVEVTRLPIREAQDWFAMLAQRSRLDDPLTPSSPSASS